MKYLIMITFLISTIFCFAQDSLQIYNVYNLSAPKLGITSSSAVLLWDDSYIPDYTKSNSEEIKRIYYIFKDGKKIGSTKQQTYPVYNLSPSTIYTFTVSLNENYNSVSDKDNAIQITTRNTGDIFNIKDFGAVGDGKTLDTKSIQNAIDNCTKNGKVIIPDGTYIVDHIELKSDMTLEIKKGARLNFLGYKEGGIYPDKKVELQAVDGTVNYNVKSLIRGYKIHDVVITGEGVINGNGETWWPYFKKVVRPHLLQFVQCSNILVQRITMQDPPSWNNHLVYVDNAIYSDVKFLQVSTVHGHNGDGLDPDASRNILIVGCLFGNQDDSIAIKAGKSSKNKNNRYRASEYITIRDCLFDGNAAPGSNPLGIGIGSGASGGVRHILIKNCQFIDAASVLNIKTNRKRPYSLVEDVRVENITYTNTKHTDKNWNRAPLSVDMFYYGNPDTLAELNSTTPLFRNIHFKNIHVENSVGRFAYLRGMPEQPIQDITFENISGSAKTGFHGEYINGLNLINVNFKTKEGDPYNLLKVTNVNQASDKAALNDSSIYKPYKSSQDTSLTLYANFFKSDKPLPILVWMHGWHGKAKRRSSDDVPPPLSKKWFLIQPDMRGRADSEGKQDCNGWELQDVIDAVEFAKKEYPALILNSENISLIGGSGGGGNVLGLVGKFPDYFCAAVAEFPISDYGMWYRADSVKMEFRDEMETKGWIGGSPETNAEAYASRGGLTTVENLLTPLAIIHGDNDRRVQVEQSRAYVNKAKQVGKRGLVTYLELAGVGAFKHGAHYENITDEQMRTRVRLTKEHFIQNTQTIEIPRKGKFVIAGYLKTKHFEVILDNIDHIGEVVYDLDNEEFTVTSNTAKTAILKYKKGDNWTETNIKIKPSTTTSNKFEKDKFHIYLLMGQSNMAGRGVIEAQDTLSHPRVYVLDKDTNWVIAKDPLHYDKPAIDGTGLGLTFGKILAEKNPEIKIGLVPLAKGGTSIDKWRRGEYDYKTKSYPYNETIFKAKIAMQKGTIKGILWHQGESDSNSEEDVKSYKEKFISLIDSIKMDLSIESIPIVIGELGHYNYEKRPLSKNLNMVFQKIAESFDCIGLVKADGLNDKGDNIHFSSKSYRELGKRYASKMMDLQSKCSAIQSSK